MNAGARFQSGPSVGAAAVMVGLWVAASAGSAALAKSYSPWEKPLNVEAVPGTNAELKYAD